MAVEANAGIVLRKTTFALTVCVCLQTALLRVLLNRAGMMGVVGAAELAQMGKFAMIMNAEKVLVSLMWRVAWVLLEMERSSTCVRPTAIVSSTKPPRV